MKLENLILLTLFFFCLFFNATGQTVTPGSVPPTQNVTAKSLSAELEDYFQKAAGLGFSGSVLAEKGGKILLRKGYGWADVKRRIPIAPDTIFDIGSGVKSFTATAIMQLEEQGKLSTSDLMSKYIKDVPSDKKDITIHQLLTHTSGLNFDYFYDQATPAEREIIYVYRAGDAVPQAWNVEFRWYKDDDLIAVVLTNRRVRAGSIRRYAMPHLVDISLFGKPPQLPAFTAINLAKLRQLEGVYTLESEAFFRVEVSEAATGDSTPKPILIISGQGQQAIDLLFSGNELPGLNKLEVELSEKTKPFIEALRNNDINALRVILPENSSPEDAVKRWKDFVKQNGELQRFEVLGTAPLNQRGVQTFVRLKFKKTEGVYKVTWRDQKLHEQEEDRLQPAVTAFLRKSFVAFPLNLSFLPQSETDFTTYDLFKGRTIKVSFTQDKLIVHTKNGDVVAQKAKF